ncbi:MAG: sugar ABC transporter permease [Candidatus Eisenbacteria sp.]|nr:sugar ABC transporter permease [Candidatus Eisenbacteria bacterium]
MSKRAEKTLLYGILLVASFIAIYPVLRVFGVSLRPGDRLLSTSLRIIPEGATLYSYRVLLLEQPFLRWMLNSTIVAAAVTVVGASLASAAGYAFSRYRFKGRHAGLGGLLITQMFPVTMLLLPLYIMLSKLGLVNTFLGLIIAYTATALPFCVWQMKGFYDTIPTSLEEAAALDGCTGPATFLRVILPLALPGLAVTSLFAFITAWSEYLVAAQIIHDQSLLTLPLGLKSFQSNMTTEWGLYAAGAVIVSVPAVAVFLLASRWLVSGLTLGSVKG